jgi:GLPGLI family protein
MKSIIHAALILLLSVEARAQYTLSGKIEFERRINLHAQIDDMIVDREAEGEGSGWLGRMKERAPKYISNYFDYTFNSKEAIYKPGREVDNPTSKMMMGQSPAIDNTVYTSFTTRRVTASKQVFEQKFLVVDSIRNLTWKITDEIRTIQNFKCRKAVSRYCDSVYVVAFYTEDIAVSGGPESFAGLPGMILEIAVPRLHATWIAGKIDVAHTAAPEEFKVPEKGKKVDQATLNEQVFSSTKNWGGFAHRSIWWSLL